MEALIGVQSAGMAPAGVHLEKFLVLWRALHLAVSIKSPAGNPPVVIPGAGVLRSSAYL
jgi:hypothetical protein